MEILVSETICIHRTSAIIFSVLDSCPLILQSDVHLTYIIYKLRIDTIHLIEVRETVAAEIYISLYKRIHCIGKSEVLHISEEEDSLPFLSICKGEP